jgi:hypothetical protein
MSDKQTAKNNANLENEGGFEVNFHLDGYS